MEMPVAADVRLIVRCWDRRHQVDLVPLSLRATKWRLHRLVRGLRADQAGIPAGVGSSLG